jgi:hypothetical protein
LVTYPFEWTAAMLRDAVVLVAQLEIELAAHGLTLHDNDANVWNVLFDATSPRYIDLGSITTLDGWLADKGLDDFLLSSVNPLRLLLSPHRRVGRALMHDYEHGVGSTDVAAILGNAARTSPLGKVLKPLTTRASNAVRRLRAKSAPSNNSRRLAALRHLVEELSHVRFEETPESEIRPHSVQQSAQRFLEKLSAPSLLVAGRANRDFADSFTGTAVLVESDESWMDAYSCTAKSAGRDILPVVMDFRYPTPASGACYHELAAARDRLACDAVVALGGPALLAQRYFLTVAQIAETFAAYTQRWLLIDAPPTAANTSLPSYHEPLTADNLTRELRLRFSSVEIAETAADGSALILCER